jgi:hypothetical protein
MQRLLLSAGVVGAGLIAAAPAGATVDLTAIGTRIADHPAYVRVVVDFTDGTLDARAVEATDPDPSSDGRVRIVVPSRNAQAQAPAVRAAGVRARVLSGRGRVVVSLSATPHRFKYAGYRVLRAPERLVVDLYKRRPPAAGAAAIYGRPGCLGLISVTARAGSVTAVGTERGVFEHSFPVVVRAADGRVLRRTPVSAAGGRWRARLPYRVATAQTGTLEAVELSAKDGALSCLVQTPVGLRP